MKPLKLIGTIAGVGICGFFVYILVQQFPYIREHIETDKSTLLLLLGLNVLVLLFRAVMNRIIFNSLGVEASIGSWYGILAVSTLANTLPFIAGSIAKAFFLKKAHGLPYRIFTAGQIALFALVLCINGIVGIFLLVSIYRAEASLWVWGLFLVMTASVLAFLLPHRIQQMVGKERFPWPGWSTSQQLRIIGLGGLCQVVILVLIALKLHLCFGMGFEEVSIFACMLFCASAAITRLVSITPGTIGIRELLVASLAFLLGFQFNDALIASSIDRALELIFVAIFTMIFAFYKKFVQKASSESQPVA